MNTKNQIIKIIEVAVEKERRTLEDKRPISDYKPDLKMMYGYNSALSNLKSQAPALADKIIKAVEIANQKLQ